MEQSFPRTGLDLHPALWLIAPMTFVVRTDLEVLEKGIGTEEEAESAALWWAHEAQEDLRAECGGVDPDDIYWDESKIEA